MKVFISILIVSLMIFSIFSYNYRTNFNNDVLSKELTEMKYKVGVLSYALSIVPKDIKNEVFFNSLKQQHPEVEEHEDIMDLISQKSEKEDKKEDFKEDKTVRIAEKKEITEITFGEIFDGMIK